MSEPTCCLSFGNCSRNLREVYPLSNPTITAGDHLGGAETKQCTWPTSVSNASKVNPC